MMFIRVPVENLIKVQEKAGDQRDVEVQRLLKNPDPVVQEVISKITDGILIVSEEKKILFANECASRILRQISQCRSESEPLPQEIGYLCRSLSEIRRLFPEQHWMMNTKICINSSVTFSVYARYMKLETLRRYCIVLVLKDQYQLIKSIALEEAKKCGLTDRETEIWLLQRANYTYKQIASELFIAPNTVKKHMQNIHLKQKGLSECYAEVPSIS
jgi:predicted transcriptional regulator